MSVGSFGGHDNGVTQENQGQVLVRVLLISLVKQSCGNVAGILL